MFIVRALCVVYKLTTACERAGLIPGLCKSSRCVSGSWRCNASCLHYKARRAAGNPKPSRVHTPPCTSSDRNGPPSAAAQPHSTLALSSCLQQLNQSQSPTLRPACRVGQNRTYVPGLQSMATAVFYVVKGRKCIYGAGQPYHQQTASRYRAWRRLWGQWRGGVAIQSRPVVLHLDHCGTHGQPPRPPCDGALHQMRHTAQLCRPLSVRNCSDPH